MSKGDPSSTSAATYLEKIQTPLATSRITVSLMAGLSLVLKFLVHEGVG